ncbi:ABC transporter permease [Dyadobacter sp. CY312]|uniref:ABC transporter permease n=1 Tax=Dyadobacter sp. CY312 TaxID=2907303 RepID=UPI001F49251C|nr:ABC transporter permease [Dyadobacter sp. CY312]MCE7042479.1 ABC transporter permease [Dyadobacter sp. CY312]
MKNFIPMVKREFKLFFGNSTLLSVMIFAPIIYAVLIGFVYKEGKVVNLPVIVVDEDNSPLSNHLMDMIEDNERLHIVKVKPENTGTQQDLINENAVLAITIPERFEADILQKRYPEVNTFINTSNLLTANMASQGVQTVMGTFNAGIEIQGLMKKGVSASQAGTQYETFKANYIRLFNPTGNYFTFMWPAVLAVVLQQVLLLAFAVSFAAEVQNKTFGSELMGYTRNAGLAVFVKSLPIWLLTIGILGFYYIMHGVFRAPIPLSIEPFLVTTSLFVLAITFMGILFSVIIPDALKATQILMMFSTPAFLIGGFSWPLASMPEGVQFIANLIPLTPFLNAHKILLIEHGTLQNVLPYIKHLGIQIAVYGVLALAALQFRMWRTGLLEKRIEA